MALAARAFGVNSWSILVPQALMGVATVGVLYAAVRRRFPAWAALLAGAALALTPVAALMFRFNNPDALLVLLLTLGAYALLRAQETASTRWLVLAAACVGTGFLAKMLQAFLVVPVFALVYLATAPAPVRRRLWQLIAAGGALLVSAGWWVAVVALVPGLVPSLCRRVAARLRAGAGARLQRSRTPQRRRDRRPRQPEPGRRVGPHVRHRDRRSDLLAAARRARPAGRGAVGDPARAAHRPGPCRAGAVGRVAAAHRRGLQLDAGDLPRVLHGRAGARDRGAHRHGRRAAVGAAPHARGRRDPVGDRRGHGRVGLRAARTLPGLAPLARARGRRRRTGRGGGSRGRAVAARAAARRGRRPRGPVLPGRARRLRGRDGPDAAHRRHRDRRPGDVRRLRTGTPRSGRRISRSGRAGRPRASAWARACPVALGAAAPMQDGRVGAVRAGSWTPGPRVPRWCPRSRPVRPPTPGSRRPSGRTPPPATSSPPASR
ncbi:ArnT family glycosyltransferase [Actinomadura madurae]|uniref:ArnT family glycosyltransferase n=1 Tax=Actinomadura madurae TaxID=1993 RepID=UPI003FD765C5